MACACHNKQDASSANTECTESNNPIIRWLYTANNLTFITTFISGLCIFFSFMEWRLGLPFDLAWGAVVLNGLPIMKEAFSGLIKGFNIHSGTLVTIAIIAACIVGEVFAAAEIAFIMTIGEIIEARTIGKARRDLEKLLSLTPRTARVLRNDTEEITEEIIEAELVKIGDIIRILPGETIPVDGKIIYGTSSLDESTITGESLPVEKALNDLVLSGSINRFGAIDIEALKLGSDSSLQRMILLVKAAESSKAKIERTADRWASYLVPVSLLTALVVWGVTGEIIRAVTILVVFCPCALMLSTPTAIVAAMGNATKQGVIIRSGEALELLAKIKELAFDKTGTLTYGKPEVAHIESVNSDFSNSELIAVAASAELLSEHPLARALVGYAKSQNIQTTKPENFSMRPGFGISATLEYLGKNIEILAGNSNLLQSENITIPNELLQSSEEKSNTGHSLIWIAINQKTAGYIALADKLRANVAQTIAKMQAQGIGITLLSGDKQGTAMNIASQVGITQVKADLRPEDKVAAIKEMQAQGRKVCMIGDGINDAPALKVANIGVAMGGIGSDIAVEAADVALLKDDLSRLPFLINLARRTLTTIHVNIAISMGISFLAVAFASLGWVGPAIGAFVHNGGSVLVVLNASRLLSVRDK